MADPIDTDAPKVGIGCDRCHGRWEHDSMCPTGGAMTELDRLLDRLRERERLLFHNADRQSMRAEKAEAEVDRLRAYAVASRAWDDAMRSTSMTNAEKDRVCVAWRTARLEADRG